MTAQRRGGVGCACCRAATIEPFEVSRWGDGCGAVYGVLVVAVLISGLLCKGNPGDGGLATRRRGEVQW